MLLTIFTFNSKNSVVELLQNTVRDDDLLADIIYINLPLVSS